MTNIEKHLAMLGLRVVDQVTGIRGVVTSVSFDLYGCVQAILHPGLDQDGKMRDGMWFDIARLQPISVDPVMAQPNFTSGHVAEGLKGPSEKPSFFKS
jgi:hypothetical protein